MNFEDLEKIMKKKSFNGKICARFWYEDANGGEGEYGDIAEVKQYWFDEEGDLILDVF